MNKCTKCDADVPGNFAKQKRMCLTCFRAAERARGKLYWEQNKAKIIIKRTKEKEGRQDEINAYQREQYHKNRDAYRKAINKRYNERYHDDPQFRMARTLKCGMLNHFNKGGTHTFEFIGCTRDMFMDWMEWQCKLDGLRLEDHGENGWHIDHVVPCASFDFTKVDQQHTCYNWTNLRPFPAAENISKSDTIDIAAIRRQEFRYLCYIRTKGKNFDRTSYTTGTVLATTLRKQLCLGTRGNDLGQVWKLLQQAALDAVTTPETWGQSAAKLLHVVIKYTQQLGEIRAYVRACKL